MEVGGNLIAFNWRVRRQIVRCWSWWRDFQGRDNFDGISGVTVVVVISKEGIILRLLVMLDVESSMTED